MIEIPTGTATIIVAVITTSQAIVLALVGIVTKRVSNVRRDAAAVRDQVVNHHVDENGDPILMRDENDRRHAETGRWFADLRRDVGGIRGDLRGLSERIHVLEELEITSPRRRDHHD